MAQKHTLKKNYEFKRILNKGQYYRGKTIDVYLRKNRKPYNYIGVAVGVKAQKAVKRNKIKRLIRENYRLLTPLLEQGYDIVFLWKKTNSFRQATFFNVKQDMITVFQKAKLFKEKGKEE